MKFVDSIFGNRYASYICLLLAFASRLVNVVYTSFAGRDKMFLILQSKSLLEGKGLSIPQYFFDNIKVPVYYTEPLWPPGYPMLLSPFLKIFNYNIYWATTSLDIIAAIGLIIIIRNLCRKLNFTLAATNIMTLIAGCFEYPFISDSQPTDTFALLFFIIALLLSLKLVSYKSFSVINLVIVGFFLFLPCFFRYSYPPLSLVVPLVIAVYGWKMKNTLMLKKGLWVTAITFIFILSLFIFLKSMTGKAAYITATERGIYPENIIRWYPVVPASFIDLPFFTSQAIKYTGLTLSSLLKILEAINILGLIVCILLLTRFLKKSSHELSPFKWLALWGSFSSVVLFLSLGYLSLTYKLQTRYFTFWNYIYEARYYALITIFLQLIFTGFFISGILSPKKILHKIILVTASFLLFIEITHSIYFYTKVSFDYSGYKSSIFREKDYVFFNSILKKMIKENPDKEILAGAPGGDSYYAYTASFYNQKGLFRAEDLKNSLPQVSQKSILIIMLYDSEVSTYSSFVSDKQTRSLGRAGFSNFYSHELSPSDSQ